ncbi:hypothetical protein [Winogradskyella rapida]|uniref:Outer membrane protein with beta-barrel domain n=1 Tax=Winogradskyella rapida TaxID=549701 RepID=A0ABW3KXK4_9FLAO
MNDKKNIDRLFQEKFKDFEMAPNDAVWERINESLPKKKKKRRVIALWWQIGGVAALIALLLTAGISFFDTNESFKPEVPLVNTENSEAQQPSKTQDTNKLEIPEAEAFNKEKIADTNTDTSSDTSDTLTNDETSKTTKESSIKNDPLNTNASKAVNTALAQTETGNQSTQNRQTTNPKASKADKANGTNAHQPSNSKNSTEFSSDVKQKSTIKEATKAQNNQIAQQSTSSSTQNNAISKTDSEANKATTTVAENDLTETTEDNAIASAIAALEEATDKDDEESEQTKWSIAPNVAPVYFNSLGEGSSLDNQFNQNGKSADVNMSYGIAASYAVGPKLKIRAGINRVNLNQTTNDVYAFSGTETASRGIEGSFTNISFNNAEEHVSLVSSSLMNRSTVPELLTNTVAGDIDQRFGFIEIPVALEYRLLDRKFGINLIGGFSTLLLSNNEIYADVNGSSELIGEANNINDTSFSANLGFGVDYSLSKQWLLNLEPTFKYQLNTFNNTTGNFKPFFIGVYTGLRYKF